MFRFSGSKQPKPRSFDYRPRFYNPEEEQRRSTRLAEGERKPGDRLRGAFVRSERKPGAWSKQQGSRAFLIRFFLVVALFIWAGFYLFGKIDSFFVQAFSATQDPDEQREMPHKVEYLEDEPSIKPLE